MKRTYFWLLVIILSVICQSCSGSGGTFRGGLLGRSAKASIPGDDLDGELTRVKVSASGRQLSFDEISEISTSVFFQAALENATNETMEYDSHYFVNIKDYMVNNWFKYENIQENYRTLGEYFQSIGIISENSIDREKVSEGLSILEGWFINGNFGEFPNQSNDAEADSVGEGDAVNYNDLASQTFSLTLQDKNNGDGAAVAAAGMTTNNFAVTGAGAQDLVQCEGKWVKQPKPTW